MIKKLNNITTIMKIRKIIILKFIIQLFRRTFVEIKKEEKKEKKKKKKKKGRKLEFNHLPANYRKCSLIN